MAAGALGRFGRADSVGLAQGVGSLRSFAAQPDADASWQPAPLLERLAQERKTFNADRAA